MSHRSSLLAVTLLCLASMHSAHGAPQAETPGDATVATKKRAQTGRIFNAADSNRDGKLTMEEIRARYPNFPEARFSELDKNSDGIIERAETADTEAPSPAQRFARLDQNNDGKLDRKEVAKILPNGTAARFTRLDKNEDGYLSLEELPPFNPRRGAGSPSPQPTSDRETYIAKLLENHDGDRNKQLTLAEIQIGKPGFPASAFSALDRDNNEVLDAADFGPLRKKARTSKRPKTKTQASEKNSEKKKAAKTGTMPPRMDSNKDGKISFEEARAANPKLTRERFDQRDKNGDGFLSKEDRIKT